MAEAATSTYTPGSSRSSLDDMLEASQTQLDDALSSAKEKSDKIWTRGEEAATSIRASRAESDKLEMPELMAIPEAPKPEMRDPLTAFGSTASIIGMLASTMTRRPLVHALNAASGVMNAYRQQDLQGAKLQFETFKAQLENAKIMHDWQQDRYNAALNKIDKDQRGAVAEVQALAHAFQDTPMLTALQHSVSSAYDLLQKREDNERKMQELKPKLDEENTIQAAMLEFRQGHPNATAREIADEERTLRHPSARGAGRSGDLTEGQEIDDARQYYNSQFPLNSMTGTRSRLKEDGTTEPAPEPEAWIKNQWPKIKAELRRQRQPNGPISGYVNGLPVAGQVAPAATTTPTAKPAPTASTPASDFIAIPASLTDAKDGTVFQDTKGTYGKPGAYWIIRNGKAFPTQAPNASGGGSAAPVGGGRGGDIDQGAMPAAVQAKLNEIAAQGGTNEQIARRQSTYLNSIDPTGQMLPSGERRNTRVGPDMSRAPVTPITQADIDRESASDTYYHSGKATPLAFETPLSQALQGMETTAQEPVDKALRLHQIDPKITAELDRRFPAKPGERSFADIARSVKTLNTVSQDQSQQFAGDVRGIEGEHNRQLKNTKLLEMAWNASPARRKEILAQLEGGFTDATPSQKLEIVKLYVANLMGIGGGAAAEAAAR